MKYLNTKVRIESQEHLEYLYSLAEELCYDGTVCPVRFDERFPWFVFSGLGEWEDVFCTSEKYRHFDEFEEISLPLPKQQLKENNTFTKDMLLSGEHVVETREGGRYLVAGNFLIAEHDYLKLESYKKDLTLDHKFTNLEHLDVMKVYSGLFHCKRSICAFGGFNSYLHTERLTLLWERETLEQEQKRLAKEAALAEVERLEKELELAKKVLAEKRAELEG